MAASVTRHTCWALGEMRALEERLRHVTARLKQLPEGEDGGGGDGGGGGRGTMRSDWWERRAAGRDDSEAEAEAGRRARSAQEDAGDAGDAGDPGRGARTAACLAASSAARATIEAAGREGAGARRRACRARRVRRRAVARSPIARSRRSLGWRRSAARDWRDAAAGGRRHSSSAGCSRLPQRGRGDAPTRRRRTWRRRTREAKAEVEAARRPSRGGAKCSPRRGLEAGGEQARSSVARRKDAGSTFGSRPTWSCAPGGNQPRRQRELEQLTADASRESTRSPSRARPHHRGDARFGCR